MDSEPEKKTFIHAACKPEEKTAWVRAAIRDNLKLTAWIVRTLNEKAKPIQTKQAAFNCNVANCGNGHCVHQITDEHCPDCGNLMIEVATTGFKFCSSHPSICDYECKSTNSVLVNDKST